MAHSFRAIKSTVLQPSSCSHGFFHSIHDVIRRPNPLQAPNNDFIRDYDIFFRIFNNYPSNLTFSASPSTLSQFVQYPRSRRFASITASYDSNRGFGSREPNTPSDSDISLARRLYSLKPLSTSQDGLQDPTSKDIMSWMLSLTSLKTKWKISSRRSWKQRGVLFSHAHYAEKWACHAGEWL